MRSITKFKLYLLYAYLVGTQLVGMDKSRSKAFTTSKKYHYKKSEKDTLDLTNCHKY